MKQQLLNKLENPNDLLICVDLDGTLCEGEYWGNGKEPQPYSQRINYINDLYNSGAHIIIYSARLPYLYQSTLSWLIKYGVKFHGIAMYIKPGADIYIDDKSLNIDDINLFS